MQLLIVSDFHVTHEGLPVHRRNPILAVARKPYTSNPTPETMNLKGKRSEVISCIVVRTGALRS